MTSDNRIHILRDGTLMITNAGSEDVGEYECMARNSAGEVKSPAYSLSLVNQSKYLIYPNLSRNLPLVWNHCLQQ